MHYQEFEPGQALGGRVRYWRLTGHDTGAEAEPVLPDGCVELIVHLGTPFLLERDGRRERQPRALCAGPGTVPVRLVPDGRIDVIGVRFEAGALAECTGIPARTLVDRLPALDEIEPGLARGLAEELAEPRVGEDWRAVLDRRLGAAFDAHRGARIAARAEPARRTIAGAVARLRATGGCVGVAELARAANLSPRQLERCFRERVGLGPKTFARLVRFQRALGLLRGPRASLARVAAQAGYYDQAHMVRDFRQFAEASPSRFLATEPEFAKHFVDAAP